MDFKSRLKEFKEMADHNAAIDSAFLAGVQSVTPMREFSYIELWMIYDCVSDVNELTNRFDTNRPTRYTKQDIAQKIMDEIRRREESAAPYRKKKEAEKLAATDALESAH